MRKRSLAVISGVLMLAAVEPGMSVSQEVMAVLSSESSYYRQAWDGYQQQLSDQSGVLTLRDEAPEIPEGVKVVVAFGAKAALQPYPKGVTLVYCMAPGTVLPENRRPKRSIKVEMLPRPGFVLSKIKELQPGLRRLAVFWSSEAMDDYMREIQKAAPSFGVEIEPARPAGPDDVPDRLRALKTKPDALWLPPDPTLITPASFSVLKEYAWSNRVPFYVPTDGLVEKGATASIACGLREIGRITAAAVRQLTAQTGGQTDRIYPEAIRITVSRSSAKSTGLDLNEAVLAKDTVILP